VQNEVGERKIIMATKNLRKAKLDKIMTKIAMFILEETFTDEPEAQAALSEAIRNIEKAANILVASDEAQQAKSAA
jgi:hypothetical protein